VTRPPPPDQPSPEQSARFAAELRASVQAARRLGASTVVPGPDGQQQVRVLPEGERTRLTLVEHGHVLAQRWVDTQWLIEHLERAGQTYAVLVRLLTDPDPDP